MAAVYEVGKSYPKIFEDIIKNRDDLKDIKKIMAPIQDQMYMVRVMGVGRLMVICKETEVTLVNGRTNEKEKHTWDEVKETWEALIRKFQAESGTVKESYFNFYNIELEEEKVAPVQLKKVNTEGKNAKKDKPNKTKDAVISKPVERVKPDIGDPVDSRSTKDTESGDTISDNQQRSDQEEDFINRPRNERDNILEHEQSDETPTADEREGNTLKIPERVSELRPDLVWKVGEFGKFCDEGNKIAARNKLHAIKELISLMLRELEQED